MNKIILVAATALLAGCSKHIPNEAPPTTDNIKVVAAGLGFVAYEITLSDGTRCVTVSNHGIDCEWRKQQ